MKIISKFKDYYDRALALGQDDRIPYIRLTEEIPHGELSLPTEFVSIPETRRVGIQRTIVHEKIRYVEFYPDTVWVCGKTYRCIKANIVETRVIDRWGYNINPDRTEYFYTYEQLAKFTESIGFLVQDIYRGKLFGRLSDHALLQAFLTSQGTVEAEKLLIEKRLVVLRERLDGRHYSPTNNCWEHNFPLSDVQFYKMMDPYQVYQELDMYVCGVLGRQAKEVVNISDKDRIYQHGFDNYSFKKLPEERKKKQKPR